MAQLIINGLSYTLEQTDLAQDFLTILDKLDIAPEVKCGGIGQCGDCVIKVRAGKEYLSALTLKEKQLLGNVFYITQERLACQCYINSVDAQVEIES